MKTPKTPMKTPMMSPSIFIYKFPFPALTSITNRVTGVYLTSMFCFGGYVMLFECEEAMRKKYTELDVFSKKLINYSAVFSGTYHTLGGLRHFVWDKFPHLLTNSAVNMHSKILICASVPATYFIEKML